MTDDEDFMDDDGYPTEAALDCIEHGQHTIKEYWELLKSLWRWDDYYREDMSGDPIKLELHTGGWSGNESLINAAEDSHNPLFWLCHTKWERGGHYYFEVPVRFWEYPFTPYKKTTEC